jgi:hypothetical protein
MNFTRLTLFLFAALLVFAAGCTTPRDPLPTLKGWKLLRGQDPRSLDPAIVKDYRQYIQQLPEKERVQVTEGSIHLYENSNGQHAVLFEIGRPSFIGLSEIIYARILIYDRNSKRIEVRNYRYRERLML